jgi:large subunit ribosomal protein L22
MQVRAHLRSLRMSPRKVRLVVDAVRGLPADAAVRQLEFSPRQAARPVLKLLKSAMANAEHNHQADVSKLRVAKIAADSGPTLHRWKARAHGRAAPIRKRTTHVQIILSDEYPADLHRLQVKGGNKRAVGVKKASGKRRAAAGKDLSEKKGAKRTGKAFAGTRRAASGKIAKGGALRKTENLKEKK